MNAIEFEYWLASSLFASPGTGQSCCTSRQVSEHFPGHRIETGIGSSRLKQASDFAQICMGASGERQQEVPKHLLSNVERLKRALFHAITFLKANARSKRPRNAVRLTELLGGGAHTLTAPVNEATMPAL